MTEERPMEMPEVTRARREGFWFGVGFCGLASLVGWLLASLPSELGPMPVAVAVGLGVALLGGVAVMIPLAALYRRRT